MGFIYKEYDLIYYIEVIKNWVSKECPFEWIFLGPFLKENSFLVESLDKIVEVTNIQL